MAKLLGKGPNQVPTNADLGTMAFQDREGINVNTAVVANLVVTGATSVNATFAVVNSSANVFFAAANGNIGIANTTPTYKLFVDERAAASGTGIIYLGGGAGGSMLTLARTVGGSGNLYFGSDTSRPQISFRSSANQFSVGLDASTFKIAQSGALGANEYFAITVSGNTGIGTVTPDAKLAVAGTANVSGNVYIGSNVMLVDTVNRRVSVGDTYSNAREFNIVGNSSATVVGMQLRANTSSSAFAITATTSQLEIKDDADASPSFLIDKSANVFTFSGGNVSIGQNLTVTGNLTVSGTTTYINTTNLNVSDNIVTLLANVSSGTAPTQNAGLEVNRGSSANTYLLWNESAGGWQANGGAFIAANSTSNTFVVVSNGNFGIGNSAPNSKLVVQMATNGDANNTTGIAIDVYGSVIRVGDAFGTAQTFANGVGLKIHDAGYVHYSIGQIGKSLVLSDSSSDGNALFPASRTDLMTANIAAISFANTSATTLFISSNGNIGIGNTTPTDKLSINGTILANNLRRFTLTRTLSITVNDTVEIGYVTQTNGAHDLLIAIQVSDSGFSISKQYRIAAAYSHTANNSYRKIIPEFDSGVYGGNDFDLEGYSVNNDLFLRLRRTAGSTPGVAEILIEDLVLGNEGSTQDTFTPTTATATGVAAVTENFPGNRVLQTGPFHNTPNTFIVVANTTVNAITANNTTVAINVPVSFGQYTTLGYTSFVNLGLTTSATTANQVLSQYGAAAYRAAKFFVQITSGSAYQATEITLIHDGTNVYKSEYGTVYSGAVLATFDADINSGLVRLLTTPVNAVTVYKGIQTQILI